MRRLIAWLFSHETRAAARYRAGYEAGYVHGVGFARDEAHRLKLAEYRAYMQRPNAPPCTPTRPLARNSG